MDERDDEQRKEGEEEKQNFFFSLFFYYVTHTHTHTHTYTHTHRHTQKHFHRLPHTLSRWPGRPHLEDRGRADVGHGLVAVVVVLLLPGDLSHDGQRCVCKRPSGGARRKEAAQEPSRQQKKRRGTARSSCSHLALCSYLAPSATHTHTRTHTQSGCPLLLEDKGGLPFRSLFSGLIILFRPCCPCAPLFTVDLTLPPFVTVHVPAKPYGKDIL